MKKTKAQLKGKLDKEMEHIQFSNHQQVLNHVYPTTWKQKLLKLWNKEISIPLVPISVVLVLFILVMGYPAIKSIEQRPEEGASDSIKHVDGSGYFYWESNQRGGEKR
ncbi:hypothetical protein KGF86_18045 [Ornithinibacillus massiliensis]|uniref:Oligopeptide transport permease C-like N-terminal domain-containing protein n=1 Tax=Ornithinibacillus massiliensis TaxID=1944633 RepID=A0ABS5MJR0_9BACI|nr:hypothetical protein [Ornithinibacillus massiliensis]MBS3682097.1 hypothetical protein [Ornithinibacillus massiliensis]